MRARVSIVRSEDYAQDAIRRAILETFESHGGLEQFVRPGERVLLKPNFVSSMTPVMETYTHPEIIRCMAELVVEIGAHPVVGDSPAFGSARGCVRKLKLEEPLRRLGAEIVEFKRGTKVANSQGKVYSHLHIARTVLECDKVINLPKLKTHQQLYLTGAVKNCFGCVAGKRKAWWHFKAGNFENYFARMLVETWQLVRPAFNLMDGVTAMEGQGPAKGTGRFVGVLLGGTDAPAIDRVMCEIVGADASRIRTLMASRELGIGTPDLDRIETVGESPESFRIKDFQFPKLMAIGFSFPRIVRSTMKQAWMLRKELA